MTTILQLNQSNIASTIQETTSVLRSGGLVVFPSDTVYGLLVDAKHEGGVSKLLAFKDRPPGKAVSVFVSSMATMATYAHVDDAHALVLHKVLPGAFTVALPSKHILDKRLESERGTLGIRLPNYQPVTQLVAAYGSPVTATSANMAGRSPHHSIDSLLNQLSKTKKDMIDLIVDAGRLPRNKPSTVVDLSGDTVQTLREGDVSFQNIQSFISISPKQTQQIGYDIISHQPSNAKPIVIILTGDLGAGKTEMTRGIASNFDIENIVSPTYVVYYEYKIVIKNSKLKIKNYGLFIHVDLYNIQEEDEFEQLNLQSYLVPGNVMVVEWGEKLGKLYEQLSKKAHVVYVNIAPVNEYERKITVKNNS